MVAELIFSCKYLGGTFEKNHTWCRLPSSTVIITVISEASDDRQALVKTKIEQKFTIRSIAEICFSPLL